MKKIFLFFAMAIVAVIGMNAQVVTSDPAVITQSSKNIVLTYHADDANSNKGLVGLPDSEEVYAHIGLITDKSSGPSDWKYGPSKWGDNSAKYKLTKVAANTYTLTISSFKEYFGLPDGEIVEKIALVFRTADCKKEGKTSAGGDIFVDVYADGFNMSFTSSITGMASVGETTTLKIATNQDADISLSLNGTEIKSVKAGKELVYDYKFTTVSNHIFKATAKTSAGVTDTKEIAINVPTPSVAADYPGGVPQMGAVPNSDGSVTFCLAAPNKKSVILVPSWADYEVRNENVMNYQDYEGNRYFWTTVKGLDPTKYYPYYYIVDGSIKVGDPYARLVLDPYSDKFLDKNVYPKRPEYPYDKFDNVVLAVYSGHFYGEQYGFVDFEIPDHKNLVIYELLLRDFTGTVGQSKGNGTLKEAIEKIPYLKSLGVNAVELMPIMEFNGNNSWGYNTNFYFAPDKAYGSPNEYKDFINLCHANGIAVILDIVFNQSDGLHPWYQMYPISSNPFYNQNAPHDYSVLNDWKQDNALVQQQWDDVIRYWMTEYNVDGFRFDLVKGLGDNSSYGKGTEAYNQSRVDRMKRLHGVIKSIKPNGIHINEHLAGADEETQMANDGQLMWANFNWNSAQFVMGYDEDNNGGRLNQMYNTYGRPANSIIAYAESHDEERVAYKVDAYAEDYTLKSKATKCKRLGALAVQLLLTPGPKMIWQFGELGANQTTKGPDGNNTDPKTVIWDRLDDASYAGLHEVYTALCNLRLGNPEMFTNGYTTTGVGGAVNAARTITLRNGGKEIIAFINGSTSGTAINVTASASNLSASNNQLICATLGTTPTLTGSGTVTVSLAPHSMAVFATKDVDGIDDVIVDENQALFSVYGGNGEIVIVGEYQTAQVHTLDGRAINRLDNLSNGIYIVNVDGTTSKVAVK